MSILSTIGAAIGGKVIVNIARRITRDYKLKKAAYLRGYADGAAGKEKRY